MATINEKLGLRRAPKRPMMRLPDNRAAASALTAAQCPACARRGVREAEVDGKRMRLCQWCSQVWEA